MPRRSVTSSPGTPPAGSRSPEAALNLRLRILRGDLFAMGPGKAALLEQVDACHSIAGAGRTLGFSYSKTRRLVDELNACFQAPLVDTTRGGRTRGGASLTPLGRQALEQFRDMESVAYAAVLPRLVAYLALLKEPPAAGPTD